MLGVCVFVWFMVYFWCYVLFDDCSLFFVVFCSLPVVCYVLVVVIVWCSSVCVVCRLMASVFVC